jgi:hypothetical protein
MKLHPSITADRVMEAIERYNTALDNPGFCIKCGEEADGVEPDAREYRCEFCNSNGVYGAEELLFHFGRPEASAAISRPSNVFVLSSHEEPQ